MVVQLCPAQWLLGATQLMEMSKQESRELSSRLILATQSGSSCRNGAMGWQGMVAGLGSGPRRAAVARFIAGAV
jgi:hypothetical protein